MLVRRFSHFISAKGTISFFRSVIIFRTQATHILALLSLLSFGLDKPLKS
jgi:hypothetical protein